MSTRSDWPQGVLNRERTLQILREHNAWRRGAEGPQTDSRMLGLALDAAIEALASAPQPPSGGVVRAKPLEWQEDGPGEWCDRHHGFHITQDDEEPKENRFTAAWGEGDPEWFPTLEEAQAWCQEAIDRYVREWAVSAPPSAPVEDDNDEPAKCEHCGGHVMTGCVSCGESWLTPSAPVGVEAALRDALQGLIDFIEIDNLPMDADAMFIAKRAIAQQPPAELASIPKSSPNGWLQDGGLLYRLTVGDRPQNRDEINVTMVHGSRKPEHLKARAAELLSMIQAPQPPSAPVGVEEMQRRLEREESDHGRTIDQRDAAEDALGRMFQAVTGREAEWSSAWGYADAVEEVEEYIAALAQQPAAVDGAMRKVAAIAHSGGLIDLSPHDALTAIRRLSLPYWGKEENPEQVRATLAAQPGGGKAPPC